MDLLISSVILGLVVVVLVVVVVVGGGGEEEEERGVSSSRAIQGYLGLTRTLAGRSPHPDRPRDVHLR